MLIYIVIIFFTGLEVFWDWYIITKKGRNPNYVGSNILRLMVAIPLWICFIGMRPNMTAEQFIFIPVLMATMFWFLFDMALNIARGLPYWYLGNKSHLDLLQKSNGGAYRWFWIKLLLLTSSIVIFEKILT